MAAKMAKETITLKSVQKIYHQAVEKERIEAPKRLRLEIAKHLGAALIKIKESAGRRSQGDTYHCHSYNVREGVISGLQKLGFTCTRSRSNMDIISISWKEL